MKRLFVLLCMLMISCAANKSPQGPTQMNELEYDIPDGWVKIEDTSNSKELKFIMMTPDKKYSYYESVLVSVYSIKAIGYPLDELEDMSYHDFDEMKDLKTIEQQDIIHDGVKAKTTLFKTQEKYHKNRLIIQLIFVKNGKIYLFRGFGADRANTLEKFTQFVAEFKLK